MTTSRLSQALEQTEVAGGGHAQIVVADALQSAEVRDRLIRVAARGFDVDRLLSIVLGQTRTSRALAECTWTSLLGCVRDLAQLGLYVGPLGHAYLVPFMNKTITPHRREATLILGYKGMIVLARRSGEILDIRARPVYTSDYFEFSQGLEDVLVHRPNFESADRGELKLAYGVAKFANGGAAMHVMTKKQIDAVRARSRAKDDGPWKTDYDVMACKTVIRYMGNRGELPLTIEAADAYARDEARELGYAASSEVDGLATPAIEGKPVDALASSETSAPAADPSTEAVGARGSGSVGSELPLGEGE